jgi:uncharacterized protein YcbX
LITVSQLWIYPVKACRGIPLKEAHVGRRGIERDRRYMIVDDTGQFVTQRERPELCRLHTAIDEALLTLTFGAAQIAVPIALVDGPRRQVTVWGFTGPAIEHPPARDFLSQALGAPHHLVYLPDDITRPVPDGRLRDPVSYADGYPLLLLSEGSLAALNARLSAPVTMRRFRPNLVVTGCAPFAEDGWATFRVGALLFRAPKPCARCAVLTVDPETGATGREPLATLATFRARGGEVWFGMNAIPDGEGEIAVGDALVR